MSEKSPPKTEKAWLTNLADTLNSVVCHDVSGQQIEFSAACDKVRDLILAVRAEGRRIYWVGNGGSAALCSHLSQDFFNKLKVRSQVFSDHAQNTCLANDFGYEHAYRIQVERFVEKGDLLIAVSSGGNSKNILNSVEQARSQGARIVALSGFGADNKLRQQKVDVSFYLNSNLYGIVEVGHECIIHSILETTWLRER